jgi:uncharacterized ion transporter superfamily protein YfcC
VGVVTHTGAINSGVARAMEKLKGRDKWMIPILMGLFALRGTTYGMAEETLAFYMLIIPIMIAAGYDAPTGVAIIMLGAGIGVIGSTINPFATTIAANAADIPFTQGMTLRLVILVLGWLCSVVYVMRYAEQGKRDPTASLVAGMDAENKEYFSLNDDSASTEFRLRGKIIVGLFSLTFAVMIWGMSKQGWSMGEMTALFLAASLVIGVVGRIGEKVFVEAFVDGARDLLGVALIIGIARGIVVIMDAGNITDTLSLGAIL